MRKSRFSKEQMVKILRETDKAPVAEVSKKHGVSEQTIYTSRKRFCAMNADEVKRLRQREVENARLKKMLAERDLEIDVMKGDRIKKMGSTCARRAQVLLAEGKRLSRRRACALLNVSRSCLGYVSRLDVRDRPVIEQMRKLTGQYPRYGYRRIRIFLRRAGLSLSIGRTWRLWTKAGLQVPRKRPRRRVASQRDQVQRAPAASHLWAYDFVFDTCANTQHLKCLSMEYFRNRREARVVTQQWRRHCNAVRPHSEPGYLTPAQFVESLSGKDHEATFLK